MLRLSPKLPITDEDRQWVDQGFCRLEKLIGRRRLLRAKVVLPTPEYFPDPYDGTAATLEMLFYRVCDYMEVNRSSVELEVFADETEELRDILPYWHGDAANRTAGLYVQHPGTSSDQEPSGDERSVIAIRSTQLKDPLSLVATVAHELGHVILIGGGLLDPKNPDHEPMTDLLTVFLGLGVFTANSAARFKQYQEGQRQGWSMQRLGYLPEQVHGYALARFAAERGEDGSDWVKHLSTNVRAYFKQSRTWLIKNAGQLDGSDRFPR